MELAEFARDMGYMPEQVQDFYPTLHTLSTVMYCTGLDPSDHGAGVRPRSPHEKAARAGLSFNTDPENYRLVHEALVLAGREDLIDAGPKCLIPPPRPTRPAKSRR
ncbi:MAG: DUF3362 domain-containing protein [Oscillospiraceae bacterium]